ncbi:hypothetical protein EsH8_II_001227 [Colletotrichum jinshuiense]
MGPLSIGLVLLPVLWIASHLWALYHNYKAARATGLPLIVLPFDPENFFHVVFSVPLRPLIKRLLPASVFASVNLSIFGWEFQDKTAVHDRVGPSFMLVTTGQNLFITADPAVAQTILTRRKEFIQSPISNKVLGFLGANILTVNGDSWSRQRRIVAPALNERISADVWKESGEQASDLADLLLSSSSSSPSSPDAAPDGGSRDTLAGLRAIAINVLSKVAYGRRKPFGLSPLPRDPTAPMSYVDAISLCTEFLVFSAFIPIAVLRLPAMPLLAQTLGAALHRLPGLTRDMLDQERRRNAAADAEADPAAVAGQAPATIMSMLVRLSDQAKSEGSSADAQQQQHPDKKPAAKSFLTEEEIAGNLFVFTAAGFDTTANTMAYAVALLALHPEWQAWIQAEIDAVLGALPEGAPSDYAAVFPRLTRCLAVMYETLRVCPPLVHITRSIEAPQAVVPSSGSSYTIPAPCTIHINTIALHGSPSTWGPDAAAFKPSRWLQAPSPPSDAPITPAAAPDAGATAGGDVPRPQLVTPPRGAYLAWSGGPRACPGQKMSQVEFVTVFATLFRRCRVEPVARPGESAEGAKQRLRDLIQDSQPRLTLQMNRPGEVNLRWVRR